LSAIVKSATDPRFGDYQVNGVMALAKRLKGNPRKLAEQVVAKMDLSDICEQPEIAGPGFINLRLKPDFVAKRMLEIKSDTARLGIEKEPAPKTVVVDFSGPNIAKQMHVGHLRSTIIGDCICRLLDFEGHKVIPQNHIGDWGTALGKVILGLWHMCMAEKRGGKPYYENDIEDLKANKNNKQELENLCNRILIRDEEDWEEDYIEKKGDGKKHFRPFLDNLKNREKSELWEKITVLYQYVNLLEESLVGLELTTPTRRKKKYCKKDEEPFDYITIPFENLSRHATAMLQNIDDKDNEQEKIAWEYIREISLEYCHEIYRILNVKLSKEHVRGESDYRKDLSSTVKELLEHNIAIMSKGAICIFPDGFKTKDGEPMPFIIQKSDEAHLYATTDLAAIKYRIEKLKAETIIYVTDARQQQHFQMLFAVAEMAGWAKREMLHHVTFGSVLGEDEKPLKTRSGENVKLKELLDEAVARARKIVDEKNPELSETRRSEIAQAVGIGAVKYADFTNNRTSDYIFSFDKMLAMEGNTAPYMQYAYARIRSIERKAQSRNVDIETELAEVKSLNLSEAAEFDLARHLIRYGEAVNAAAGDYRPNYLTSYLYDLAQKFSTFYNDCPVLDAGPDKRPTRLLLCDLTARTIEHGLKDLLGIEVIEQM